MSIRSGPDYGAYSVALLLDQSGSISNTDPNNYRIDAARIFCNSLGSGDNVALSAFASSGHQIPYELTLYNQGNFTSYGAIFNSDLEALKTQVGGTTPLYKSTYKMVDFTSQKAPNQNKAVVVFTDGEDTDGGRTMNDVSQLAVSKGIKVFTIGLGSAQTASLAYMANKSGGSFMYAADARQLITMFGSLGQLLSGTTYFYRTNWRLLVNQNLNQTGWWLTSSVKVNLPNGTEIYIPFRLDY